MMQAMGPMTRLLTGAAGIALIASTFLPWATAPGGADQTGWDLTAGVAALALIAGLIAVAAALTKGTVGLFRPDVSMRAAADLFGVATTLVVGAFLLFDLPDGADAGAGVVIALAGAIVAMAAAGDYRVFKGAPVFPRIRAEGEGE